jgi:hypothetical protein
MSLEHSPGRQGERAAFTISEFCDAYRVSRSKLYAMWRDRIGPRFFNVGVKVIITAEAAADWAREREAAAAAEITSEKVET